MLSQGGAVGFGPRSHVVQLYRDEGELARGVTPYLADAIESGGVALVVATHSHCAAMEAWLAGRGLDTAAARLAGALVVLDAAAVLRRLSAGGVVDPARFGAEIGSRIRQAVSLASQPAGTGGPVRVYGEMVAELWQAGHVNAALELEELWNALSRAVPFSLYCAYPWQSVEGAGRRAALTQVRRLHEAEVSPPLTPIPLARPRETATFEASLTAPRAARHFLAGVLARWHRVEAADDAALTVTELATNAVTHGRCGFTVAVSDLGASLRISVGDTSPLPAGAGPGLPARAGHGLGAVAAMAARWGVQTMAGGKAVWAELSC